MAERKGASRRADIPADVLRNLNAGTLETATLAEGLAIDFQLLLSQAVPELHPSDLAEIRADMGVTSRMKAVGQLLVDRFGVAAYERLSGHASDTVRGWSAYVVGDLPGISLKRRLQLIRPLADDTHFGVREWAWLAVRNHIALDILDAITLLTPWTRHKSENIRRYASEITRPRGVWCSHIQQLKTDPSAGETILAPLRSDPSLYVRNSVANWLNDAGKTQPEWVHQLCLRWSRESPTPETQAIIKRATRNLK